MNSDALTGPLSLCSAHNCAARAGCRRYRDFMALPVGGSRGRSFVCTSGTLGAKCPRYVPTEKRG